MDWLIKAARAGRLDKIKKATVLNVRDEYGDTPLVHALRSRQFLAAELLLSMGADPMAMNNHRRTPMHVAAYHCNKSMIDLLVANGADVDCQCAFGDTPLMKAVVAKNLDTVKALLELGASPDIKDSLGSTPLMHAAKIYDINIATVLLENGANAAITDMRGNNALNIAIKKGWTLFSELVRTCKRSK